MCSGMSMALIFSASASCPSLESFNILETSAEIHDELFVQSLASKPGKDLLVHKLRRDVGGH